MDGGAVGPRARTCAGGGRPAGAEIPMAHRSASARLYFSRGSAAGRFARALVARRQSPPLACAMDRRRGTSRPGRGEAFPRRLVAGWRGRADCVLYRSRTFAVADRLFRAGTAAAPGERIMNRWTVCLFVLAQAAGA